MSRSLIAMSAFGYGTLRALPRLAPSVRVREEEFGGLVFKGTDMAIYEINGLTLQLLRVVDGARSLASVISSGVQDLGGDREDVERVLHEMLNVGVIVL